MKKIIIALLIISLFIFVACSSSETEEISNNFKNNISDTLDAFGHLDNYEVSSHDVTVTLEKEYDKMSENAQIEFINKVCDRVKKVATDTGIFEKWDEVHVKVFSSEGTYLDTYIIERE